MREPIDLTGARQHFDRVANCPCSAAIGPHLHVARRAQRLVHEFHDLPGNRRREKQRLPLRRQRRDNPLHVGPEAHVHHAIRFVQHQHLQPHEIRGAVAHVIHQPSGRRDDDVDAGLQCPLLRIHRHAAVDRGARHLRVIREPDQRVLDLHRQLARRRQHERAGVGRAIAVAVAGALGEQRLQNGRGKRQRLSGAGLGARDAVAAGQRDRNHRALHRARALEAEILQALHQPRIQPERVERNGLGLGVHGLPGDVRAERRRFNDSWAVCAVGPAALNPTDAAAMNGRKW